MNELQATRQTREISRKVGWVRVRYCCHCSSLRLTFALGHSAQWIDRTRQYARDRPIKGSGLHAMAVA